MSLAFLILSISIGILLCGRCTMSLTSKVADMSGSARKRSRSNNGGASGGLSKSPNRDGMDQGRDFKVSEVDFDGIAVLL